MKTMILSALVMMTLTQIAQAKPAQTISGRQAIKEITSSFLDPKGDVFEGDSGCSVELKERGHDLEIKVSQKNRLTSTLEFSEAEQYRIQTKGIASDSTQTTISSLDGKQKITILPADDAFNEVTTTKDGVTVDCQQDM